MHDNIKEYCKSVGLGDTLTGQVESLLRECQSLVPNHSIQDAFIGEYTTSDGSRVYDNLHFFTDRLVFEIENFVSRPTIWIQEYGRMNIRIEKHDFDFTRANPSSRLAVTVDWTDNSDFALNPKATGDNCLQLIRILRKYVLPYVTEDIAGSPTQMSRAGGTGKARTERSR
jgi:hypothetical protein